MWRRRCWGRGVAGLTVGDVRKRAARPELTAAPSSDQLHRPTIDLWSGHSATKNTQWCVLVELEGQVGQGAAATHFILDHVFESLASVGLRRRGRDMAKGEVLTIVAVAMRHDAVLRSAMAVAQWQWLSGSGSVAVAVAVAVAPRNSWWQRGGYAPG